MNHPAAAAAWTLCLTTALNAWQAVPEFEVVAVRRSAPATSPGTPGTRAEFRVVPGGRFEARGQTLADLARVAFGFDHADPSRGVVRAADWMWNDRFDITAAADHQWTRPPAGTAVPEELRLMLRALLEERFALRARVEPRNVDVTALRLAKPGVLGPGLRLSSARCRGPFTDASPGETPPTPRCPFTHNRDRIEAEAVTLTEAAQLLAQIGPLGMSDGQHRPLVDGTGLAGRYDLSFQVPWKGVVLRTTDLLLALESQLGLKIVGTRMPIPTLVIDRAEKPQED